MPPIIIEEIEVDDALSMLRGFAGAMETIVLKCKDKELSSRVYVLSLHCLKMLLKLYDSEKK